MMIVPAVNFFDVSDIVKIEDYRVDTCLSVCLWNLISLDLSYFGG